MAYTITEFRDVVKGIIETKHKPYLLRGRKEDIKIVGSNSRLVIDHEALTGGGAFQLYLIMGDGKPIALGMKTYKSDPNSSAGENRAWEEVRKKAIDAVKTIFSGKPTSTKSQQFLQKFG